MSPLPDFLQPVRGPHRLAWLALATAALVLLAAALDAAQAWQARADAARPLPLPARKAAPPPARGSVEARLSVQRALARLDRPWPATFQALEAVDVAGVNWLALEIGEGGAIRLEGSAPDSEAALAAARALRRQPGLREVVLGRIESPPAGALRFELSAAMVAEPVP
jgi:hypothetical protein